MNRNQDLARSPLALKTRYLTVNFIGLAMIASVFVYAGIVEFIKWRWAPFSGFLQLAAPQAAIVRYIFLAFAAGQYGVIRLVQKIVGARSVDHLPQAAIITLALCESVAILGLMLFFAAGQALDFYMFMVVSLGFFYLFFPKYDDWEKRVGSEKK